MPKNAPTGVQRGNIDCDGRSGMQRRSFLKTGAFSFLGLSVLDLLRSSALAAPNDVAKCDAVILVWLAGGPSHIDTFDPKPGHANNGPYKAIASSADGIQLCQHMPTIARNMKHASLIRSLTSKEGSHERATYEMHTGYKPLGSIAHPSLGSLTVQQKGKRNESMPAYVSIGNVAVGAGFLGSDFAPFYIGNVRQPTNNLVFQGLGKTQDEADARFKRRIDILRSVDQEFSKQDRDPAVREYGNYYKDALKMMYSNSIDAFDLAKENPRHLKSYGVDDSGGDAGSRPGRGGRDSQMGRSLLMARRLVEKGVRFVECSMGGWDTHREGFTAIEGHLNSLDPALGALLEDMNASGLLKRTMVICTGEFGRTPKINAQNGRDHFPRCWSALIAGGGIKSGYVHGSTDASGGEVRDKPVTVGDLHATLCEAMGIDFTKENLTPQGRPIRIVDKGAPVKDLFA